MSTQIIIQEGAGGAGAASTFSNIENMVTYMEAMLNDQNSQIKLEGDANIDEAQATYQSGMDQADATLTSGIAGVAGSVTSAACLGVGVYTAGAGKAAGNTIGNSGNGGVQLNTISTTTNGAANLPEESELKPDEVPNNTATQRELDTQQQAQIQTARKWETAGTAAQAFSKGVGDIVSSVFQQDKAGKDMIATVEKYAEGASSTLRSTLNTLYGSAAQMVTTIAETQQQSAKVAAQ